MRINGFLLPEVLLTMNIIILVSLTIIPVFTLVAQEKKILHDRAMIAMRLHDELQLLIWDSSGELEKEFTETISDQKVAFHFTEIDDFIKGCAVWNNVKQRPENICYYGLVEE